MHVCVRYLWTCTERNLWVSLLQVLLIPCSCCKISKLVLFDPGLTAVNRYDLSSRINTLLNVPVLLRRKRFAQLPRLTSWPGPLAKDRRVNVILKGYGSAFTINTESLFGALRLVSMTNAASSAPSCYQTNPWSYRYVVHTCIFYHIPRFQRGDAIFMQVDQCSYSQWDTPIYRCRVPVTIGAWS